VLSEVGIDLPSTIGVRNGQGIARNRLAAKPYVVQPPSLPKQVDLDVAQVLSIRQLGKGHGEELVQTGEVLDACEASVVGHTAAKRAQRQVEHELHKNEIALVPGGLGQKPEKNPTV
jgi:hypothetical protein